MIQKVQIGNRFLYADDCGRPGLDIIQNGKNYEVHVRKELERLIPKAMSFLDIGANIGVHSVNSKEINPDVSVFAIEVSRKNIDLLYRTIADNGFKDFTVIPVAAASSTRLIGMNSDLDNTSCGQSACNGCDYWTQALPVSFYNLPKIDVIKIDIEGFEYDAWLGMEKIIDAGVNMIFEFCPQLVFRSNVDPKDQLNWLIGKGYTLTVMDYLPGMRKEFNDAKGVLDHISKTSVWIADILAERK